MRTPPSLAMAIRYRRPVSHLLELIKAGADVNEKVVCYPYEHTVAPLLVLTIYQCIIITPSQFPTLPLDDYRHHHHYLLKVLYLLLEHGADPSCFLPFHGHLIPFLCMDPGLLPYMIERGLTISLQGETGRTILHRAIEYLASCIENPHELRQRLTVIYQLLDVGVEPDLQDRNGKTALHSLLRLPITPPLFNLLRRLLPMTDVTREDNQGNTPLHMYLLTCSSNRKIHTVPRQQVIDLLTSKGAETPFLIS